MVDGVLASCYPSTDHDVGHLGMAPMRWFPTFMEPIFGVTMMVTKALLLLKNTWVNG